MATKQFIGSGKSTKYNGVIVTLKMEEAQKYAFETENGTFLTFIVSARKETDKFGKTHTAFVLVDAEGAPEVPAATAEVAEPTEKPKKKGRSKK